MPDFLRSGRYGGLMSKKLLLEMESSQRMANVVRMLSGLLLHFKWLKLLEQDCFER